MGVKLTPIRKIPNGKNSAFRFGIRTTDFTKVLRRVLYTPQKNIYNRKLLNRLNSTHIAIWYMDDGGLSQKRRGGRILSNELMLNTHTSKENNQILIDYFREVWGVRFNQYKNGGHYRLACGTKEARKFISIVKPSMIDIKCMKHKLNVKPLIFKCYSSEVEPSGSKWETPHRIGDEDMVWSTQQCVAVKTGRA